MGKVSRGHLFAGALAAGVWLLPSSASAQERYDATTLEAVIGQNVNVMAAHQRLLRAQSLTNFQGFYYGISGKVAPAKYTMSDGTTEEGGLARNLLVLGGRGGDRELGFYGGLQLDWATASGFPNPFQAIGQDNGNRGTVVAGAGELVFHGGLSVSGVSIAGGFLLQASRYDADPAGRFIRNGLPDEVEREFRPGSPESLESLGQQTHGTYFVNLDYDEGYFLGALVGKADEVRKDGERVQQTTVSAVRALAQPYDLIRSMKLPEAVGFPGLGLNRYAPGVDYYGDRFQQVKDAAETGAAPPATRDDAIYEIPLVSDQLGGLPIATRVIGQVSPTPMFRLADVSVHAPENDYVRAGARAMFFKRGDGYTGSFDAYGGLYMTLDESPGENRNYEAGLAVLLAYSYNSPDSTTFVPLPNAHVFGIQVSVGLPEALPPPVPIFRDPLDDLEAKEGEGE